MFVIRGQAQATEEHPKFSAGSIHSLLAVGNSSSEDELISRVQADLLSTGFGEVRCFEIASVPVWRALLPTPQGRMLRSGFSAVSITLYSDDDQTWAQPDA
jgi:hypothetical protein